MKPILFFVGMMPFLAQALPVYPNSGSTNAKRDPISNIPSSSSMSSQEMTPQEQQEDKGRKKVNPDDILPGPYNQKGEYRYIPEIRSE